MVSRASPLKTTPTVSPLSQTLKNKERLYKDRKTTEQFYGTLDARLNQMIQTGFMTTINQEKVTQLLSQASRQNHVKLEQFYFGDSLTDGK